jgi:orotate phosphoribosyltransferase
MSNPEPNSSEQTTKDLIVSSGAVLKGHFRLASGRHSDTYVEKFRVLERPWVLEQVTKSIADHFRALEPEVVIGPSTGGLIVAYEVARQLNVPALYVERVGEKFVVKRGGRIEPGVRVLLVDDVLTTGVSVFEVLTLIREHQANVLGVGVLIDRSQKAIDFGCQLFASCHFEATSYDESEIPEWLQSIPLTTPGTRASVNGS